MPFTSVFPSILYTFFLLLFILSFSTSHAGKAAASSESTKIKKRKTGGGEEEKDIKKQQICPFQVGRGPISIINTKNVFMRKQIAWPNHST